jgi:catechol 2,3-dioxygenase-like lactoylglutathione lyase family enzyme
MSIQRGAKLMADAISTGPVHHVCLTVTDVARSQAFYTGVLNFTFISDLPAGVFLGNGALGLALRTSAAPERAPDSDRFDEARVGLDHLSLQVASRADLEAAAAALDARGVSHGEIKDLGEGFGILVLAFRDPDNIQLELTAPRA